MKKQKILEEIAAIDSAVSDPKLCQGTAETYSRITGYYRNVSNFNEGKQTEYSERTEYKNCGCGV